MKKTILSLSLLLLLVMTTSVVMAARSNDYRSDVYTFGLEQVTGARAHLQTSEADVQMSIHTKDLTPGDAIAAGLV